MERRPSSSGRADRPRWALRAEQNSRAEEPSNKSPGVPLGVWPSSRWESGGNLALGLEWDALARAPMGDCTVLVLRGRPETCCGRTLAAGELVCREMHTLRQKYGDKFLCDTTQKHHRTFVRGNRRSHRLPAGLQCEWNASAVGAFFVPSSTSRLNAAREWPIHLNEMASLEKSELRI